MLKSLEKEKLSKEKIKILRMLEKKMFQKMMKDAEEAKGKENKDEAAAEK
jgi:hypothetical protein